MNFKDFLRNFISLIIPSISSLIGNNKYFFMYAFIITLAKFFRNYDQLSFRCSFFERISGFNTSSQLFKSTLCYLLL